MTVFKIFMDSSAWLAYFLAETEEVKQFIEQENFILTSVVTLFEIKRKLLRERYPLEKINKVLAYIKARSPIVELTEDVADFAADISITKKLAAMDSLIYASAQKNGALLITGDTDFKGLEGVNVLSS